MVLGYTIFIIWPKQTVPGFSLVLLSSSTPLHPSPALFGRGQPIQINRWFSKMSFWTTLFGKCRLILMIWIICKILLIHQVDPDNLQKQVKAWFELFPLSVQRSYIFFPFCSEPPLGLVSKLLWQVCYSLSSLSKQGFSIPISKQSLLHPLPLHNFRLFVQLSTNSKPLWHCFRSSASRK